MITTIIFDLGNVLLNWKPAEYLDKNGFDSLKKEIILNDVFKSREWMELDNGDITLDEAINSIGSKSALKTEEIRAVFNLRTEIIFPLTPNTRLLPVLKKQGFRLYYLSNFPDDIFDEIYNKYDFFSFFDGGEISARLGVSKPDPRIFRILMEKYSLQPEECLFIDDIHHNTNSAEALGIRAIHLQDPDMLMSEIESILGKNLH